MSGRIQELNAELRMALRARTEARVAESVAKEAFSERRAARKRAEALVEEIQAEVESGKTGRPIIDRINGKAEEDTADERQRGPTLARAEEEAPAGAEPEEPRHVEWTSDDLTFELERAIYCPLGLDNNDTWNAFRKLGAITDLQILEVIRSIWPAGHAYHGEAKIGEWRPQRARGTRPSRAGYSIHGGSTPGFWVGARRAETLHRPTLMGMELVSRVRSILGLPRAPEAVVVEAERIKAEAAEADKRPVAKRRARKGGAA